MCCNWPIFIFWLIILLVLDYLIIKNYRVQNGKDAQWWEKIFAVMVMTPGLPP